MRRLKVDLGDIAMAMEMQFSESANYLDLQTGEVVVMPPELQDEERIFDEEYVEDLPAWEQELVPVAREITGSVGRYASIPTAPSYQEYDLMVEFAQSVRDPQLRELLVVALDGRGAFGRFKRVLEQHPRERERWFSMRDQFSEQRVREWLEELEIEPLEDPSA